jgi:hypothetical protein
MMIWILALVLFGCVGYVGWTMGAIRAGLSLLGLLVGSVLAFPLGKLLHSVLNMFGLKNPLLVYFLGPLIVFLLVLIIFKIAGFAVHKKVDVYYKYKAGDLKMGLFERLNQRLGLCLGLANAAVYLILISLVIYIFSYATVQIASGDGVSGSVKTLNMLGNHVKASGMAKITAGVDPMPASYYQASDILGLIYHNDLLESRLSRYPAFLALGERPEFQDIANDKDFTELRLRQPPISEIIDNPKAQSIINNPDLLKEIWSIAVPDLADLEKFLTTGQSAKYDNEKILGRWIFSPNAALALIKKAKPNLGSTDMQRLRRVLLLTMAKANLIAAPDKKVIVKNVGVLRPNSNPKVPPTVDKQTWQGQWDGDNGKYTFTIDGRKEVLSGQVEGDRLTIIGGEVSFAFDREL